MSWVSLISEQEDRYKACIVAGVPTTSRVWLFRNFCSCRKVGNYSDCEWPCRTLWVAHPPPQCPNYPLEWGFWWRSVYGSTWWLNNSWHWTFRLSTWSCIIWSPTKPLCLVLQNGLCPPSNPLDQELSWFQSLLPPNYKSDHPFDLVCWWVIYHKEWQTRNSPTQVSIHSTISYD